jgi:ubiquinone/menaquinone biosynthesis C-methylase UbiE
MRKKNRKIESVQPSVFPSNINDVYDSIAPYVPAPLRVVRRMLECTGLKTGETLFDLGCGDGRIVLMAAQEFGAKGFGVDLIGQLIHEAKRKAVTLGLIDDVEFIRGNLFEVDLSSTDVVTMYLLKNTTEKVRIKLEKELKPGARVVTLNYPIIKWTPDEIIEIDDEKPKYFIYLYRRKLE